MKELENIPSIFHGISRNGVRSELSKIGFAEQTSFPIHKCEKSNEVLQPVIRQSIVFEPISGSPIPISANSGDFKIPNEDLYFTENFIQSACFFEFDENVILNSISTNQKRFMKQIAEANKFKIVSRFFKFFFRKIEILVKNPNFGQKSKFWSKIQILIKNPNFDQKS